MVESTSKPNLKVDLSETSHGCRHVHWLSLAVCFVVMKKSWRKWETIFQEECKNAAFYDDLILKIRGIRNNLFLTETLPKYYFNVFWLSKYENHLLIQLFL